MCDVPGWFELMVFDEDFHHSNVLPMMMVFHIEHLWFTVCILNVIYATVFRIEMGFNYTRHTLHLTVYLANLKDVHFSENNFSEMSDWCIVDDVSGKKIVCHLGWNWCWKFPLLSHNFT